MIPINQPVLGDEERKAVLKVLESGLLSDKSGEGAFVKMFEEEFRKYIGVKYAVALNSGTAALHASLMALGIGRGDEVILPSFTFCATAETVLLVGGKPVMVDIDPKTFCIDPNEIRKSITPKTKAIIPVHLFGMPVNVDEISEIAERHCLHVIGDAAQAHGAQYKSKKVGCFFDVECFSFYPTKNITTGEGGMVTTNNEEIFEKIRMIRSHGEEKPYRHVMIGHNYRLPEVSAAIGWVQTRKIDEFLKKRRHNAERLIEILENQEKIEVPEVPENVTHSWHLFTLKAKRKSERNKLTELLNKRGIGTGKYYENPLHTLKFYAERSKIISSLNNTVEAAERVFQVPVHPLVDDIDLIGKEIISGLKSM